MWAFFSRRLRMWLVFAVAVPLGGALARAVAGRLERRRGSTRLTRTLYSASDLASRRGRRRQSAGTEAEARR